MQHAPVSAASPVSPVSAPESVHIAAPFSVVGIATRTTNRDEAEPSTARLSALWDRFFSHSWERRLPGSPDGDRRVFGVYSAYESDAHGAFDVTAGVALPATAAAAAQSDMGADTVCIQVEAGDYLVFRSQGAMPQMVIDAWGSIWRYFAENPQVRRRFGTDFEAYSGPDEVAIHIGVVAAS